jgi:UDP-glucose:glycoprotein glucosyltransferase
MLSNELFAHVSPRQLLQALGLDVPDIASPSAQAILSRDAALGEITGGVKLHEVDAEEYSKFTSSSRLVARKLGLSPGQTALLVNGRVSP